MSDRKIIYLDDALDALRDEFKKAPTTAIRAMEVIRGLPPAQPENVKCKKCRYVYYDKEFGNYWCNRKPDSFMVEEDGYCKWGK